MRKEPGATPESRPEQLAVASLDRDGSVLAVLIASEKGMAVAASSWSENEPPLHSQTRTCSRLVKSSLVAH